MYFILIAIVILLTCGFLQHRSKQYMRDAIRNIPGPLSLPILGALYFIIGVNPKNIIQKRAEAIKNYGNVVSVWIFNRLLILSVDTELNEQILTSSTHIVKSPVYDSLHQWLGSGLLVSSGQRWHSRRKIITPAFHFNILEEFLEVFDRQSTILLECLAKKADGTTAFDVNPLVRLATFDVIAETAMGTLVNAQRDQNVQYTEAVKEMTDLMAWRFTRPHLLSEFLFSLLHPHKKLRQMKLLNILHDFDRNVIVKRRNILEDRLKRSPSDIDCTDEVGAKKPIALLDILLQSKIDGKPLTNEDIREEVATFMFAGHDTTAAALSYTLYLLARHPKVQSKLLAEIRNVYNDDNSMCFTLQNLNSLKYMECVIKESLRLHPPIPVIGRKLMKDFKYKHSRLGDGILPAGAEINISINALHNAEESFNNASEFIPERHENSKTSASTYSFMPFSIGPRNCIGQKFAMYEMKVMLKKIVQNYELLPLGEKIDPVFSILMHSDTGMQLGMRKRIFE